MRASEPITLTCSACLHLQSSLVLTLICLIYSPNPHA